MMIGGSNSSRSSTYDVFTASQWQELEHQLLTFKYLMSGIPVPPELISTVITHPSSSPRLFPLHQTFPFGWGCFQVGYGRKLDAEPGRCRRTDGKKWRCTKEACPDSKYCERHIHRGKNKTKKPSSQMFAATTPPPTTDSTANDTILSTPTSVNVKPLGCCVAASPAVSLPSQTNTTVYSQYKPQKLQSSTAASFYPFLSPSTSDQSLSFSPSFIEATQHNSTASRWFLDPHQSYDQPKKEFSYLNDMKGTTGSERMLGPLQDIGCNILNKEVKEGRFGVNTKDDETQKQLYHHFLGD